MRIDIYADLVCPWCFIGKRRLERALALRPHAPAVLDWQPFQLNPDMPAGGIDADTFWAERLGPPALVEERRAAVRDAGAASGIEFAFSRIRREPNTLDAHRLVRFAAGKGRADAVVEALFRGHFIEGRDIGNRDSLTLIAVETGLERQETARFLAGDGERDAVLAAAAEARRLGVTAVPCYVFERQYAVAGAQEPEFFLPILDLVETQLRR